jgi:uncharacterized protein YebE (UPF0316 family)
MYEILNGLPPWFFNWVLMPILIFLARVSDMSVGTVRVMLTVAGKRRLVPFLGFIESLVWLLAVRQIIQNLDSPISYIAYAAGFGAGIFVGLKVDERLAVGMVIVRVITPQKDLAMIESIRKAGYGLTVVDGEGQQGAVSLLFVVTERKKIEELTQIVKTYLPNAFYTIESIKYASQQLSYSESNKRDGFFGNLLRK